MVDHSIQYYIDLMWGAFVGPLKPISCCMLCKAHVYLLTDYDRLHTCECGRKYTHRGTLITEGII